MAGPGVVGDFVALEARSGQIADGFLGHLCLALLVGQNQFAGGGQFGEAGAGVDGELVGREVLGFQCHRLDQGLSPGRRGLAGQTVDQVEAQVVETGLAGQGHRQLALGPGMGAVDSAQGLVVKGLDADTQPVDPGRVPGP